MADGQALRRGTDNPDPELDDAKITALRSVPANPAPPATPARDDLDPEPAPPAPPKRRRWLPRPPGAPGGGRPRPGPRPASAAETAPLAPRRAAGRRAGGADRRRRLHV